MIEHYLSFAGIHPSPIDPMVLGGLMEWVLPGTYEWIVPKGVTSVGVLVISAGLRGRLTALSLSAIAGKSGCIRWRNNIPVTPGETFTVVVGSGGTAGSLAWNLGLVEQTDYKSSALGLIAGVDIAECTPLSSLVLGANGMSGGAGSLINTIVAGGNAPNFTVSATTRDVSPKGISLNNTVTLGTSLNGGDCGGGGALSVGVIGGIRTYGRGGHGGVKIIWGYSRAFPNTNITS